jgi:3-oxoacyl-[acyl-carrier protein] reductase
VRDVLVTGGTRGLGLTIATRLARSGYRVVAVARQLNEGFQAEQHQANLGAPGSLVFRPFDLGDVAGIPAFVAALSREFGPWYGLVNNAGLGTSGVLATLPDSQIEHLLRLNVASPIAMTKYIVRSMMARGPGRIVTISSIVASTGYSGLSVYSATKAALGGFTRSLARELGPLGMTVNCVAPGFIETDMTNAMDAKQRDRVRRRSALGRLAEAKDVAAAVAFLLSDEARNITGTTLTIDAGNTA